ncbi:MAG: AarF/ABC1/UbiB kinase family protein [Rhodobiaceae bacterium]|nr:AarF/ABC1/UbiB kinase family protein [Rhodobiaceae bacterium]
MDRENNRFSRRLQRYAKVGTNVGGAAAKMYGARFLGVGIDRQQNAEEIARALGGLKGPIMKVAQLLATIPEALPPEYAAELSQLQADAPPMGRGFVRRRMAGEMGRDWQSRFAAFDLDAAASASLGQVHRATGHDGRSLACKLQYPDMQSAVEADLRQLQVLFAIHRRMDPAIDTSEMYTEISARIREELDYVRERAHMRAYGAIFDGDPLIRIPEPVEDLSTRRLLTMTWLEGTRLLNHAEDDLAVRNRLATAMFRAWWYPFSHYGVIHGDPHLGNYTVFDDGGGPAGINLLDFGCIRVFPPSFVKGVIDLYNGIRVDDRDMIVSAYETWGFKGLNNELIDVLNIWARFIYGPLLDDRVRSIAGGISPAEYGRKQAFQVHQALKEKGPVRVPREFVFMDRAAIGLGGVFLHLKAELNYYRLFNDMIGDFDVETVAKRQKDVLAAAGVRETGGDAT